MSQTEGEGKKSWIQYNPPVFIFSAALTVVFLLLAVVAPEQTESLFASVQGWIIETAGWFYILMVACFLIFVIYLAASQAGQIKLGPDHSEPDYSYLSWFAMLFSAGMGIGLMFFGVAEPVMHYVSPPTGEGETVQAARDAMRITFFHWGIHAWGIYAVVALSLAYFSFRHGLPLTIRSSLYPLIGNRIYGVAGHAVDTFAVFGTLFGVATSLGFGVIQVNSGLNYLFGLSVGVATQVSLIAGITVLATLSVCLGLDRGIRRISELNIILAVGLTVFVLVAGPTVFILQTFVQNIGNYLSGLMAATFNLYAYEPKDWIGGWTLFYWGWWIAWSPFVGMFIARVSRGRTIREFVVGVLFVPVGFTFVWLTVFGDTALHMLMERQIEGFAEAVETDTSVALFQFFEHLPFTAITSVVATLLVITFFVTSSDSGSLVVDMLTSGGSDESPVWQRIFWSITEGLIAAVLLVVGGLGALQTATIASALPFTCVMILICWGLIRALRMDVAKRSLRDGARVGQRSSWESVPWKQRLRSLNSHQSRDEVGRFFARTVMPALKEVAEEFAAQGIEANCEFRTSSHGSLSVPYGGKADFLYQVRVRGYDPPAFAFEDTKDSEMEARRYFRAEVHLKEGGQGYDITDWSQQDIIEDVLAQYESHLKFMEMVGAGSTALKR